MWLCIKYKHHAPIQPSADHPIHLVLNHQPSHPQPPIQREYWRVNHLDEHHRFPPGTITIGHQPSHIGEPSRGISDIFQLSHTKRAFVYFFFDAYFSCFSPTVSIAHSKCIFSRRTRRTTKAITARTLRSAKTTTSLGFGCAFTRPF